MLSVVAHVARLRLVRTLSVVLASSAVLRRMHGATGKLVQLVGVYHTVAG